jgi:RHS repeat-associated protein
MGGALTQAQMTEVQYDALGNITYKSDVGEYWYDAARPSRMTSVTLTTPSSAQVALAGTRGLSYAFDDYLSGAQSIGGTTIGNGNLMYTVSHDTVNSIHTVRSETYTSFNMPSQVVYGNFVTNTSSTADRTLSFVYGPEHQRLKQTIALSGNGTSSYQSGTIYYANGVDSLGLSFEKAILSSGLTENKHYLAASGEVYAIYVSRTGTLGGNPASSANYVHQDRLGSVGVITSETGAVKERFAHDPWGKRRYTNGSADVLDAIVGSNTRRGYTMHEHLDEVGVIHMNARIYDPLIARFMSADSVIPNPADLKSFNRYSYGNGNPMIGSDPTGHTFTTYTFKRLLDGGGTDGVDSVSDGSDSSGGIDLGGFNPASGYDPRDKFSQMAGFTVVYDANLMRTESVYESMRSDAAQWAESSISITGSGGGGNLSETVQSASGAANVSSAGQVIIAGGDNNLVLGLINTEAAKESVKDAAKNLDSLLFGGAFNAAAEAFRQQEYTDAAVYGSLGIAMLIPAVITDGQSAAAGTAARLLTAEGTLKTSATVANQLSAGRSYIPIQSVLDTVASGSRIPDPQGVAGQFMYRAEAWYNNSRGTLEVLVDEMTGQINHILFRRTR